MDFDCWVFGWILDEFGWIEMDFDGNFDGFLDGVWMLLDGS